MVLVLALSTVLALVLSAACRLYFLRIIHQGYLKNNDPALLDKGAEVLKSWPQKVFSISLGKPKEPSAPELTEGDEDGP